MKRGLKYFIININILVLILSVFSFSFIFSEINFVSAAIDAPANEEISEGIKDYRYSFDKATASILPVTSFGFKSLDEAPPDLEEIVESGIKDTKTYKAFGVFEATNPYLGNIMQSAQYASIVIGLIQGLKIFVDEDKYELIDALSMSAGMGFLASGAIKGLVDDKGPLFEYFSGTLGPFQKSTWAGLGVAALVFLLTYKEVDTVTVTFTCLPWQAPVGGGDCEKCNDADFGCSEYQCRSLGQSCELINKGTTEEACVWVNRNDVNPPVMQAWEGTLLNDYFYTPDNAVSPPDRGVKLLYSNSEDNCIPAFTPLRFGVTLDEPATCKIDVLRKETFDGMAGFLSGGLKRYNHSYTLTLPSPKALASENITIENSGDFQLYLRCQDANGNANVGNFQFRYCVDEGPDTTPPLIVTTDLLNGAPIAFGEDSLDLEVYINEPSQCKWDRNDRSYDTMEETMDCSTSIFSYNSQLLYKCETTLEGINDGVENDFYFRCEDNPNSPSSERNANSESYKFTVVGTRELFIDVVEPNDTLISDSTDTVKVTIAALTIAGYDEGASICYYSGTGNDNDFVMFFETDNFRHSQELFLTQGSYEYLIRCVDLGGNSDTKTINFDVETDTSAPIVVRAFKEDNFLRLITHEEAQCVYSTFGCAYEFDEGTDITVIDENNHFIEWTPNTNHYIKCEDAFGNQPSPNQCSISVAATEF